MTVPSENYAPLRYRCNGSATQFSVTWPFFNASDIKVVYIGNSSTTEFSRVLNGNYSVTGGSGGTGAITTLGTDPSGNDPYDDGTLIITRVTPITQTIDYRSTKAFSPAISERALDKLTRAIQERESSIDFCLKLPATTNLSVIDTVLETPTAGGTLVWNAEANKIISGSTVDAPVSAWAKTLIDDVSASAAMGTLGFSEFFRTMVSATTAVLLRKFMGFPETLQPKGYVNRPKFTWASGTAIYISPGTYDHLGTKDQYVSWNSQLTFYFGPGGSNAASDNLAVNSDVYLYLDDSAIVTHASATLTAACFINKSGTFPTWNASKHGHYNGLDRCIFGVRTSSTVAYVREFTQSGNWTFFANRTTNFSADVDLTWTPVTLTIPAFARVAEVSIYGTAGANPGFTYWKTATAINNGGHIAAWSDASVRYSNSCIVVANSSKQISLRRDVSDAGTANVATNGWMFPEGM